MLSAWNVVLLSKSAFCGPASATWGCIDTPRVAAVSHHTHGALQARGRCRRDPRLGNSSRLRGSTTHLGDHAWRHGCCPRKAQLMQLYVWGQRAQHARFVQLFGGCPRLLPPLDRDVACEDERCDIGGAIALGRVATI